MSKLQAKPAPEEYVSLSEQFIPDHVFVYIESGVLCCYDGIKSHVFKTGDCFLVRKNRLARYSQEWEAGKLKHITSCFDEPFLRSFQEKYKPAITKFNPSDTFIRLDPDRLIANFIQSLQPYYHSSSELAPGFADVKYEELLIILLHERPSLAGILFDYAVPEKINLEAFMNCNYQFNVSNSRFAYLTGRSLSAFKRDFKTIFNTTPAHWLVEKRLKEAHLLIEKKGKKPSEIYIDLGFEDLSHFSFAFKKLFGYTPTDAREQKKAGHAS